ncbi:MULTISPECIES: hypothetical protein [Pseudoalteromonas]|nr:MULTISPECIES: hypothetical protein [Pseudoalteromonas]
MNRETMKAKRIQSQAAIIFRYKSIQVCGMILATLIPIAINYANDSFSNSNGIFGEGFYGNVFSTLEIAGLSEASDYSLGFGYLFADA